MRCPDCGEMMVQKDASSRSPLISYYGGKQRLATKIIPYIPKHTVYVEPFCGGATMLFRKPWPKVSNSNHYREVINDSSNQLINMYRVFQTRFDEIEHLIINTLYSEEEHRKAIQILKGEIESDELWQAWAYYVSSQQSFARVLNSGWGRGVFAESLAATWFSKISSLNNYRDRLGSVYISCDDALKVIKQFDSPQTFFYCDPPYPGTDMGRYKGYSQEDFNSLVELLSSCEGSAMISCYGNEDRFDDRWKMFRFKSHCSSSRQGKVGADRSRKLSSEELGDRVREERLYIKQASKPREEIQRVYDSGAFDCFTGDQIWKGELNEQARAS